LASLAGVQRAAPFGCTKSVEIVRFPRFLCRISSNPSRTKSPSQENHQQTPFPGFGQRTVFQNRGNFFCPKSAEAFPSQPVKAWNSLEVKAEARGPLPKSFKRLPQIPVYVKIFRLTLGVYKGFPQFFQRFHSVCHGIEQHQIFFRERVHFASSFPLHSSKICCFHLLHFRGQTLNVTGFCLYHTQFDESFAVRFCRENPKIENIFRY
jgi:hypothetical protein